MNQVLSPRGERPTEPIQDEDKLRSIRQTTSPAFGLSELAPLRPEGQRTGPNLPAQSPAPREGPSCQPVPSVRGERMPLSARSGRATPREGERRHDLTSALQQQQQHQQKHHGHEVPASKDSDRYACASARGERDCRRGSAGLDEAQFVQALASERARLADIAMRNAESQKGYQLQRQANGAPHVARAAAGRLDEFAHRPGPTAPGQVAMQRSHVPERGEEVRRPLKKTSQGGALP